jgi:hypothetical protein
MAALRGCDMAEFGELRVHHFRYDLGGGDVIHTFM